MNCEAVQWALAQSVPSSSAKFLLVAIASRLEGGRLAASQTELAAIVRLGVRQVRTLLKDLEALGFIQRKKRGGDGAGRLADAITIQFEQPAKIAASEQPAKIAVATGKITRTKRQKLPQQPAEISAGLAAIVEAEFVDNSPRVSISTGACAETLNLNTLSTQIYSDRTEIVETVDDGFSLTAPSSKPNKRGTRMRPDWKPSEQRTRETARELGILNGWCEATLANFIDYWLSVPGQKGVKLDWDATFRNALRAEHAARRYVPNSYQGSRNGQRTDRPNESDFIKPKRSRHIAALLGDEPDNSPIDYGRVDSCAIK